MTIEDRELKAGTRLVARYKGREYAAEVVETGDGLRYRLEDGREFKSPSSAGAAIMDGKACNGWRFWSLVGAEAEPTKAAKKAGKPKAKPSNGLIKPMEDGRWWCSACMDAFEAPAGIEPLGCPKGHTPEDFEKV